MVDVLCLLATNGSNVLSISETWITPSHPTKETKVPGYKLLLKERSKGIGYGGVAIYIGMPLKFKCRDDLSYSDDETLVIEILSSKFSTVLLFVVYRAPRNGNEWFISFESKLDMEFSENEEIIITGDFNYDLLSNDPACNC